MVFWGSTPLFRINGGDPAIPTEVNAFRGAGLIVGGKGCSQQKSAPDRSETSLRVARNTASRAGELARDALPIL